MAGNLYLPEFNTADDAVFDPPPTTEMGAFTLDHTDQVSEQWDECWHWLTLLCCRMSLVLGKCRLNVGPILASVMILDIYWLWIRSFLRRGSCLTASYNWQLLLDGGCSLCHPLCGVDI
jgi:hypothetical protein